MSSSLRNAVQRRSHRERSQPKAREKLGLLEKKGDYRLRARDYHRKRDALKKLKQKATFKNPDEFYFGMIKSTTKKGVHQITERNEHFDAETIKLLKTQDQNYVNYQRSVNQKKIERLQSDLHLLQEDDAEEDDDDDMGMDLDGDDDLIGEGESSKAPKVKHTIFVEDEEDVRSFDPAKHFNTLPELVGRKYNRPRKETLEAAELPEVDESTLHQLAKTREASYRELNSRLDREAKLKKLAKEQDLQKAIMGKGAKRKVGVDKDGVPVYKWKAVRKK
ncbi:UTP11-like, U3 small nucleolar ribonucleoprotein [Rhizophlyctis rosea]|uniref:U3 small nucleolar RNA-associated protein 11 n=1 Tax=Rhizophlyctis rosea TaxID=64517 RepID=A0AAD5SBC7_9FUNG|nr:UTP11-like, U3 small nucleolar ribonucleoprotein [Rhizophlyctis rosea]